MSRRHTSPQPRNPAEFRAASSSDKVPGTERAGRGNSIWGRTRVVLLSWFGCGLSKRAPGTLGSLGAVPPAVVISWIWGPQALAVAAAGAFFVGWAVTALHLRGPSPEKDPQWIVIDEVAGQWLVLAAAPLHLIWYAVAFVSFRLFDIAKPWPVRWADRRVPGALGIMLDDLLAGLYAAILLLLLQLAWARLA